jgi:hypothetical protein
VFLIAGCVALHLQWAGIAAHKAPCRQTKPSPFNTRKSGDMCITLEKGNLTLANMQIDVYINIYEF